MISWADFRKPPAWLIATPVVIGLALFSAPRTNAKQKKPPTRTIAGAVLDGAGQPIVGATVELTDEETGKKLDIYSEAEGRYQFSDLKTTHDYEVQATYKGQSSETRKASSLDDATSLVLNLRIPPESQ